MRTIFLSTQELQYVSRYWELYVKRNSDERLETDEGLKKEMESALRMVSDETHDVFLTALDSFEYFGVEFQVKLAPDDRGMVRS